MKLRIRGTTIRLRLDQRDLSQLLSAGRVEEGIQFGDDPKQVFSYAIELDERVPGDPEIGYASGHFVVRLSRAVAETWNATSRVGFQTEQQFGDETVRLLVEKDFACLDRPAGEEADDAFAFPNPNALNPGGGCQVTPDLNERESTQN